MLSSSAPAQQNEREGRCKTFDLSRFIKDIDPRLMPRSSDFSPALVLHGGAGTIPQDDDPSRIAMHKEGLQAALRSGQEALAKGASALDVVQVVICSLEDHPCFNAGHGAVFTANKTHELDAALMCGRTRSCGAVAGVSRVRHPIRLARGVMEKSRHVFLIGQGAHQFAQTLGIEMVDPSFFDTPQRLRAYEKAHLRHTQQPQSEPAEDEKKGTVGAVVLDKAGHLAAGTSTGGITYKSFGRIGDTPIIGAGTFADNQSCAVSCTGTGEEYIRYNVAHELSARMRYLGESVQEAAEHLVHKVLSPGDGGLIAIDAKGEIAMPFNTLGMYRGCADLKGRFEIEIWGARPGAAAVPMDH